ncbi:class II aldolase and Adducin N-terminal domain-containing protein [Halenospora varia]|nr:class II aldolase and Adducin N-terminal domain-containing protein [Halenospora varia]
MADNTKTAEYTQALHDLITANHILHYHNVLDAYGHVSVRHPEDPDIYVMSGDRAPALVSSFVDLIEYHVSDSSPVDPKAKKGYQERFIHSEIYKRFPEINSVIHSHSDAVLPYTVTGVRMQPVFHIASFLGTNVPVWDIVQHYRENDRQDMLVNNERFGFGLSSAFSASDSSKLVQSVVLMTNHGFTAVGNGIRQAVYRAVYTHNNADVQTKSIMLRSAQMSIQPDQPPTPLKYLNEKQTIGGQAMNDSSQDRPWGLWVKEVEASPLYVSHEM